MKHQVKPADADGGRAADPDTQLFRRQWQVPWLINRMRDRRLGLAAGLAITIRGAD